MMVNNGGNSRVMMLVVTAIFCSDGGGDFNQSRAVEANTSV